jgi:hypothetical protein
MGRSAVGVGLAVASFSRTGSQTLVGVSGERRAGGMELGGVTDCGDEEGTEERGEDSTAGCDMAAVFVGVVVASVVCFRVA